MFLWSRVPAVYLQEGRRALMEGLFPEIIEKTRVYERKAFRKKQIIRHWQHLGMKKKKKAKADER